MSYIEQAQSFIVPIDVCTATKQCDIDKLRPLCPMKTFLDS